jgi:hypothetical protein
MVQDGTKGGRIIVPLIDDDTLVDAVTVFRGTGAHVDPNYVVISIKDWASGTTCNVPQYRHQYESDGMHVPPSVSSSYSRYQSVLARS